MPTLDEWAEQQGLADWSAAELLVLYSEAFPRPPNGAARRSVRNARLRRKRIELLRELESVAAESATPSDHLAGWLPPELVQRLAPLGDVTLSDLASRIRRGGRWWRSVAGFGPVKAARLAHHLRVLLPPSDAVGFECIAREVLPAVVHPGLPGVVPGVLSGNAPRASQRFALPAQRLAGAPRGLSGVQIEATNDREAVAAWIAARAGSTSTATVYQREAERFLLWMVIERSKPMSTARVEDCRAYMDFIAAVPERWISHKRVGRMNPGWAPFKGPLSLASQRVALAALHSLFGWFTQARYIEANPWALVQRSLGDDPRAASPDLAPSRAFTPAAWAALNQALDGQARSSGHPERDMMARARLRWLLTFGEATGLRPAELVQAVRGDFVTTNRGWVLRVHGKGKKTRVVPVSSVALQASRDYFRLRGMDFDRAGPELPLLASTSQPTAPVGYQALQASFRAFVRRALQTARLDEADRRAALRGTLHWLRHTHATRGAERGVPPDIQQANLGHTDPRTTAAYYTAQLERRQAEAERAFGASATADAK